MRNAEEAFVRCGQSSLVSALYIGAMLGLPAGMGFALIFVGAESLLRGGGMAGWGDIATGAVLLVAFMGWLYWTAAQIKKILPIEEEA